MSNEKMSADDVLKIMDTDGRAVALYADTCGTGLRYKQWAAHLKRHDEAREAVAALIAEHNEDQGVIAVWRGRCERAEAERDALIAERDVFCKALQEIAKNDPYMMSSAGQIARDALDTDIPDEST